MPAIDYAAAALIPSYQLLPEVELARIELMVGTSEAWAAFTVRHYERALLRAGLPLTYEDDADQRAARAAWERAGRP